MIHLMVEYFNHPDENRRSEILQTMTNNINCQHIKKISIFCKAEDIKHLKEKLPNNKKVNIVTSQTDRMAYSDYFRYCNDNFCENTVYMIANNDIYFDDTVAELENIEEDIFVCLSRWDVTKGVVSTLPYGPYSQDVWAFRKKIPEDMIDVSFFVQGTMCCDNHICFLAMVHDFKLINPCNLVKAYHLHESDATRTYDPVDREIDNTLLFATIDVSDSVKYQHEKVASYICVNKARMCSNDYIENMKKMYKDGLQSTLLRYNKSKKKPTDCPRVKYISYTSRFDQLPKRYRKSKIRKR